MKDYRYPLVSSLDLLKMVQSNVNVISTSIFECCTICHIKVYEMLISIQHQKPLKNQHDMHIDLVFFTLTLTKQNIGILTETEGRLDNGETTELFLMRRCF